MSQFQASLAQRFSTITDVANVSRVATPISQLSAGSLASLVTNPINLGQFVNPPAVQPPPLTPADANTFIGTVAQTPEQIATAAVHAARVAFEAVPTAQNGDVIDAAIPNGFRSAMITLLSLAEATILQLTRQRQPAPPQTPPVVAPPVFQPPILQPPVFQPPIQIDPGILHINPAVLAQAQPAVVNPAPDSPAIGGGIIASPQVTFPTIDLGGQLFQPLTATHPETGATTTVFAPVAAAGALANISPVSGGGFHLVLDTPAAAAANVAGGVAGLGAAAGAAKGLVG
jgi:hypothetical protein